MHSRIDPDEETARKCACFWYEKSRFHSKDKILGERAEVVKVSAAMHISYFICLTLYLGSVSLFTPPKDQTTTINTIYA